VIPTTNASVIMSSVRRHLHDEALSGGKVSLPPSKNREEEREEGGGGGGWWWLAATEKKGRAMR
jgi:hypothetical protein